jgi:hypothetical protein
MSDRKRYLANPDVSCREDGSEGALLYNPDTDGLLVVNPTGLLIWETLRRPHTQEELAAYLLEVCDGVPQDTVIADVEQFIQNLQPRGFVGEVLEAGAQ